MTSPKLVNDCGETFIPPSQRPDGTWRKARRVKDGYVPQEEVPLYESKGKSFNKVRFDSNPLTFKINGVEAQRPIPGLFIFDSKDQKQAGKTKQKVNVRQDVITEGIKSLDLNQKVDLGKKIKNIKKKIREIDALDEKIRKGELAKPEVEQLQKIKRKPDLLVELDRLEKLNHK